MEDLQHDEMFANHLSTNEVIGLLEDINAPCANTKLAQRASVARLKYLYAQTEIFNTRLSKLSQEILKLVPDSEENELVFRAMKQILSEVDEEQVTELFYVQDSREVIGNALLFWSKGGGYTTDLREADLMTEKQAFELNKFRSTDLPWPSAYLNSKARPSVDCQTVCIEDALSDIKRDLAAEYKPSYIPSRCGHCGKFVPEIEAYSTCTHCGGRNHR